MILGSREESLGDLFTSTGDARREMDIVNDLIESINRDVTQQFLATGREGTFVTQWRTFRSKWKNYYDANKSGFLFKLASTALEEVSNFHLQALAFADQMRSLGGKRSAPDVKTKAKREAALEPPPKGLPTWAWAAIGLGALWGTAKLVGAVRGR